LIKPLLPNKPRGVARVNDQRVLNGIFYVLRTGSPWRDLVERFFCKLKRFRRIATRFDKLARNFLAAVTLGAARLWPRFYESTTSCSLLR
jgi:transposase